MAVDAGKPGHFYVLRQATGVLAGIVFFAIAAKIDAEIWRRFAWPIMGLSLLLMLVIILPAPSPSRDGCTARAVTLFNGSIQPSELAKFAVLVWTPMLLVKKGDAVRRLGKGLMPFIVVIGALSLLAILEPDYSVRCSSACSWRCCCSSVARGSRTSSSLAALAVPLLVQQVAKRPYVRERLRSFLAHEASDSTRKSPTADQQYQSLMAVGSGGALGVGFGQGNQQRGWLPLAYNDFVGSVVGEEFGFVGIAGLTLAFALYGWLGFRIARSARSPYCALLAVGLTFTTVFTAFIHVGVVIGLLPNTGLTLPFVSYGRSNLVLTLAMTGILVNIGSDKERVYGVSATDPLVARA